MLQPFNTVKDLRFSKTVDNILSHVLEALLQVLKPPLVEEAN